MLLLLLTVPTPTVSLFSPSGATPYADSSFTLHCTIHLDQLIDSPVTFSVSWRKAGVLISNSSRITVHDVAQSDSHTYLSMIVFSTLSMTLDSGQYSCEASLSASPPSPYITGSLSATSAYSLTVERPSKHYWCCIIFHTPQQAHIVPVCLLFSPYCFHFAQSR